MHRTLHALLIALGAAAAFGCGGGDGGDPSDPSLTGGAGGSGGSDTGGTGGTYVPQNVSVGLEVLAPGIEPGVGSAQVIVADTFTDPIPWATVAEYPSKPWQVDWARPGFQDATVAIDESGSFPDGFVVAYGQTSFDLEALKSAANGQVTATMSFARDLVGTKWICNWSCTGCVGKTDGTDPATILQMEPTTGPDGKPSFNFGIMNDSVVVRGDVIDGQAGDDISKGQVKDDGKTIDYTLTLQNEPAYQKTAHCTR